MPLFGQQTEEDQQRAEAWRLWLRSRNPLAIASLVLGVFSLIEFGALLVFGIAGIVLGVMALAQLRRVVRETAGEMAEAREVKVNPYEAPEMDVRQVYGHRLAWTGIVLSVVSLVAAAFIYFAPHGR